MPDQTWVPNRPSALAVVQVESRKRDQAGAPLSLVRGADRTPPRPVAAPVWVRARLGGSSHVLRRAHRLARLGVRPGPPGPGPLRRGTRRSPSGGRLDGPSRDRLTSMQLAPCYRARLDADLPWRGGANCKRDQTSRRRLDGPPIPVPVFGKCDIHVTALEGYPDGGAGT
jgi:hypothetical protein